MKVDSATVLIVDDNEDNRNLLARRLQRQGHRVVTAENGRLALARMRAQTFDLVLLDIMMPEMNGYQVLERIKADAALRHIPVIVISAVDEIDSVVRCIQLGAEDYLTKPFNRVLLQARIGASLEKKHLRDQEQAHVEELEILQRIDCELNTRLDLVRALNITLEWAMRRSGSEAGLVGLVDTGNVRVMAAQGYADELSLDEVELELPVAQEVIQSGQPQRVTDVKDGRGVLAEAKHQIVVPIRQESDVIGVLLLESTDPRGYLDETLIFLTRLSDHAALAIANAQLYEAVQAANQAKNDFISFVVHELKNPMTSIRGYTGLLERGHLGPINEAQADSLDVICSNVVRMDKLVSDLSDVSKIEAGQLRLELDAVSLVDAMEEVVRSMKEQIETKAQTLEVKIPKGISQVWADHTRLVQVLTNLVSNAHKYTPQAGKIHVWAEQTENQWDPGGAPEVVHVAVRDTGIGIRPEEQEQIFQKFFRSQEEAVHKTTGTGLGLNISKNLIEMQGGHVWFESEFRKGTTFHFTVPVAA